MAEHGNAKAALSAVMKELMSQRSFDKISVSQLCDMCAMNRKSFYYHFMDKYDLVNWIFDAEFLALVQRKSYESNWEFIDDICYYFYENKAFYRKALLIKGQNSFFSHFQEVLQSMLRTSLMEEFLDSQTSNFMVTFYTDALSAALVRWLTDKEPIPPNCFVELLQLCVTEGKTGKKEGGF